MVDLPRHSAGPLRRPTVVMILGVSQRSGSHWLHDLLVTHPDCRTAMTERNALGASWEDLLVEQSPLLVEYAERVSRRWDAHWSHDDDMRSALSRALGGALVAFLVGADRDAPAAGAAHVITKSPTAAGIDAIPALLPQVRVLLLVRDAHDVVASGLRTFGGSAERWIRVWREGARAIASHLDTRVGPDRQAMLVRYEDLVSDLDATMAAVAEHVGLPGDGFSRPALEGVPVRGSSTTADEHGSVDWRPRPPESHGTRRNELVPSVVDRLHWLAGSELERFGYLTADVASPSRQRALDGVWRLARVGRRAGDLVPRRR